MIHDAADDRPFHQPSYAPQQSYAPPLASEKVLIDRKIFFLDLKENNRGRFLRITEDVNGHRDTIILPAAAFRDFADALDRLIEMEEGM